MTATNQHLLFQDEKHFENIFREHYTGLVNFARHYVTDPDEAESIVQELFTGLWSKADSITIRTSVKSYLYGAVRNACLNYLKHLKVQNAYTEHQLHLATDLDTTDFLELDELKARIDEAFEQIPEKCREIFELSRYEGKKYHEIADELNLSIKTVENQMGKALKILRRELQDYLLLIFIFITHGGKF